MEQFILSVMEQFGYLGIFFLIAIENIFPPIPSEVILLFGGFMTTFTKLSVVGVILVATLGSLLGAIILYYIGKILNKERLKRIVSGKIGKVLRLKPNDSIPAGMSEMPISKFLVYTVFGSLIWNAVLTILGAKLGSHWDSILGFFEEFSHIILIILIVLFIVLVGIFYYKRLHNKKKSR